MSASTLWSRIFLAGSALGVAVSLILVSLTVWLGSHTLAPLPVVDIELEYQSQVAPIKIRLSSLLDHSLEATDAAALASVRASLMSLTVPAAAKEFHLALVLKLQQLEDLLERDVTEAITLERLRSELKNLVVNNAW